MFEEIIRLTKMCQFLGHPVLCLKNVPFIFWITPWNINRFY